MVIFYDQLEPVLRLLEEHGAAPVVAIEVEQRRAEVVMVWACGADSWQTAEVMQSQLGRGGQKPPEGH